MGSGWWTLLVLALYLLPVLSSNENIGEISLLEGDEEPAASAGETRELWAKSALKAGLAKLETAAHKSATRKEAEKVAFMLAKEKAKLAREALEESALERDETLEEALGDAVPQTPLRTVGAFAVIRPTAPVAPETALSQVLLELGEDKVHGLYDNHGRIQLVIDKSAKRQLSRQPSPLSSKLPSEVYTPIMPAATPKLALGAFRPRQEPSRPILKESAELRTHQAVHSKQDVVNTPEQNSTNSSPLVVPVPREDDTTDDPPPPPNPNSPPEDPQCPLICATCNRNIFKSGQMACASCKPTPGPDLILQQRTLINGECRTCNLAFCLSCGMRLKQESEGPEDAEELQCMECKPPALLVDGKCQMCQLSNCVKCGVRKTREEEQVVDEDGRTPMEKLYCDQCSEESFRVNGKCAMCDMEQCGSCVVRKRQVSGLTPTEEEAPEDPPPVDEDTPPPADEDSSTDEDAPAGKEEPAEGDAPQARVLGEAAAAEKAGLSAEQTPVVNRPHAAAAVDTATYAADSRALRDEASALLNELSQDHPVTAGVQMVVTDPRRQSRRLLTNPDEPPTEPATGGDEPGPSEGGDDQDPPAAEAEETPAPAPLTMKGPNTDAEDDPDAWDTAADDAVSTAAAQGEQTTAAAEAVADKNAAAATTNADNKLATPSPSETPTASPTEGPTFPPTEAPTEGPTYPPTEAPTTEPPVGLPTYPPTKGPTAAVPTEQPTQPAAAEAPEAPEPTNVTVVQPDDVDIPQFVEELVCASCNDPKFLPDGKSKTPQLYLADSKCVECTFSHCNQCVSDGMELHCVSCAAPLLAIRSNDPTFATSGVDKELGQCQPCVDTCLECAVHPHWCTRCDASKGLAMAIRRVFGDTPAGTCAAVHETCATSMQPVTSPDCTAPAGSPASVALTSEFSCTSCHPGDGLNLLPGSSTTGRCEACDSKCLTCHLKGNAKSCTSCPEGHVLHITDHVSSSGVCKLPAAEPTCDGCVTRQEADCVQPLPLFIPTLLGDSEAADLGKCEAYSHECTVRCLPNMASFKPGTVPDRRVCSKHCLQKTTKTAGNETKIVVCQMKKDITCTKSGPSAKEESAAELATQLGDTAEEATEIQEQCKEAKEAICAAAMDFSMAHWVQDAKGIAEIATMASEDTAPGCAALGGMDAILDSCSELLMMF